MSTLALVWKRVPMAIRAQVGCGKSQHLPDAPVGFWTPQLFKDEKPKAGEAAKLATASVDSNQSQLMRWHALRNPTGQEVSDLRKICPPGETSPEADVAGSRAVLALGAEDFLAERVVAAVIAAARKDDPTVERRDVEVTRRWGHTHLDEVVARAEQFTGEALVLVHRSMRHTRSEAEALVQRRFPAAMRDRVHVFGR